MKWSKKFIAILITVLMAVALLAGCSSGGAQSGQQTTAPAAETPKTTKSTIDRVKEKGELVVGTAPGYFPFEMIDKQGNIIGFDVDIAKKIADTLGVKLRIERYGFDGLIPALQTGKIDIVIAGMTITGKRALAASFSNPYYETGQTLLVSKKNNPNVKSWKDLDVKGKVIGVSLGTTGAMLAKQLFKNAEVRDFDIFPDACLAASAGKIDGIVYDEPGVRVYVSQHPDSVYGIYDLLSKENLGIAVQKDDFSTIQWLNSFLYSFKDGAEYKAMVEKWFEKMDWMKEVEVK
ncbi:MAG TPA: transporter substrate-binding domain-containing protein [Firmicutes bacterium]|nr:transporter substrate-binding domain-containing protein [Bacillota bacterium]